jgi:hypothetical protein
MNHLIVFRLKKWLLYICEIKISVLDIWSHDASGRRPWHRRRLRQPLPRYSRVI